MRVRQPKSAAEAKRYSIQNCAVEAKLMREGGGGQPVESSASTQNNLSADNKAGSGTANGSDKEPSIEVNDPAPFSDDGEAVDSQLDGDDDASSSDKSSDDDSGPQFHNPFSALSI